MQLTEALPLILADCREENPEHAATLREAVEFSRKTLEHDDIQVVDDPDTNLAYHLMLDSTDQEVEAAIVQCEAAGS